MMPIYSGSTKIGSLYVGGTKVAEGWVHDGTQWVKVYTAWSDSGITKVGTQVLAAKNTWEVVTDWQVRSGYPDTIIESDGIRVPAGTYRINATITWQLAFGNDYGLRIVRGGTAVAGTEVLTTPNVGGDAPVSMSAEVSVGAGLLQLQGASSALGAGVGTVDSGTTWWTIEKV